jgi:cardiolipin synthase
MASQRAPRDGFNGAGRHGEQGTLAFRFNPHLPRPVFSGGNEVGLLKGGDALFPAMQQAISAAQCEVWLATYIFHVDAGTEALCDSLCQAVRRGVEVRVVVDGFGSLQSLPMLHERLASHGVGLAVFRPLRRWWHWLNPRHMRRLHQKLCVVDGVHAFVGGINVLDDRLDLTHGNTEHPRLDFALALQGPVVEAVNQCVRALWTRAWLGQEWGQEMRLVAQGPHPWAHLRGLLRQLRLPKGDGFHAGAEPSQPVKAAFVLRDNLRQRRSIERACLAAIRAAQVRVDMVSPYFYPGHAFRKALVRAAQRGVQVRVLLQGKVEYPWVAWAARVLYDELLAHGVQIFEYHTAFLHAKVALVDHDWCTVGSSNFDPLSLLVNLEANVLVYDEALNRRLGEQLELAFAQSRAIRPRRKERSGHGLFFRRVLVAGVARLCLRLVGTSRGY